MDKITELMLQLLRCSLNGQRPQLSDISTDDWEKLYWLSRKHGVVTMVYDAIEKLPEAQKPQGDIALSWELSAERTRFHYNHQSEVLQSLRQKADEAGIGLILIKGMSLAKLYPRPDSRACGDIDVYFPNNYQKGNEILGNPDATLDGKHTEIVFEGVTIENHLHFLDLNYLSQRKAEEYIINSLKDASPEGYLPPMGNLVYLLMHTVCHLTAKVKLPLRNILDWGIFLRSHQDQLDPVECHKVMRHIHMDEAFNILTLISGEFIGTDLSRYIDRNKIIEKDVKKLRNLILNKDYLPPVPKELKGLKRIKARYNRRSQRRWLYRYLPSSAWERFISNVKSIFVSKIR
jgi:hypothetical protein